MATADQYAESTRIYRTYKAQCTRAANKKDFRRLHHLASTALAAFDSIGLYPDDWALFERHQQDAQFALRFDDVSL